VDEKESNVEKDGIIILIHVLIDNPGIIKNSGSYFYCFKSMVQVGLKFLNIYKAELIIVLKIIGTQVYIKKLRFFKRN
jgi:hypothetical protein